MAKKLRLRIDLKLFKDDKMVFRTTCRMKSTARARIEAGISSEWTLGRCRVWYNVNDDYWNEFEFYSYEDFTEKLALFTEQDLVETFA